MFRRAYATEKGRNSGEGVEQEISERRWFDSVQVCVVSAVTFNLPKRFAAYWFEPKNHAVIKLSRLI